MKQNCYKNPHVIWVKRYLPITLHNVGNSIDHMLQ